MSFTDFTTSHGKRIKKDHFIHLVQVAEIDGRIDHTEMEFLHREGRKFGLSDEEIDILVDKEKDFHYMPPYSLHDKFEELYQIAILILADDLVTDSEKRMIKRYAIAAGFEDRIIEPLIDLLFEGIKKDESEESLLGRFRKEILK